MRKNVKMAVLRGKGWGDHEIVSKFYLINEWKIQCKISKIKIHEESVKIKEIENFEKTRVRVHEFGWVEAWFKC